MARGTKRNNDTLAETLGRFLDRTLLPDLRARVAESPAVQRALAAAHAAERAAGRTADDVLAYRERTLEQIGAAWLLDCVFVRFLEDRGLVAHRRLAGDGAVDAQERFHAAFPGLAGNAREYLLAAFREAGNLPGARELLGARHDLARRLGPSASVAADLLRLFREQRPDGSLRWRFESDDTRVLGDLYQDLSASVRERYALLQTPDFVEAFILERTLDPALKDFGLDDFRLIDPTCGSGHFLLSAFDRLLEVHRRAAPATDPREHAVAALRHLHGVDLNPFAVAITRFRLLVAYVRAAGLRLLREAPSDLALDAHVVVADSLLYGGKTLTLASASRDNVQRRLLSGDAFVLEDVDAATKLFGRRYHAVVGNPPYIVCRDSALRERYRAQYPDSASGKFALAAPFTERFFELAVDGGRVGLINANSFMKREFGKGLIEKVLKHRDLTRVVDTSMANIPGHDTPTVILFGRNAAPACDSVRAVMARRGAADTIDDPAKGKVWSSIVKHDVESGFEDDFITVADIPRTTLAKHPWSLGGGGAGALKELIEKRCEDQLGEIADSIGITSFTLEDDAYLGELGGLKRQGVEDHYIRQMVIGEAIRDWSMGEVPEALFPYETDLHPCASPRSAALRYLWPNKTTISNNLLFGGRTKVQGGLRWFEYGRLTTAKLRTRLAIAYAEVATHNHFALDRGGRVFKQTAPIIKLPGMSSEDDHLALLSWLNSSVVCFWMKQVCMNKGIRGEAGGLTAESWEQFHQFAATKLTQLPTPSADFALAFARTLEAHAATLAADAPVACFAGFDPAHGRSLADTLTQARERADATLEAMVSAQEELDWRWYEHLGLLTDDERAEHATRRDAALVDGAVPPYPAGLRAFERAMVLAGDETAWFSRNGYVVPDEAAMARLPRATRELVETRVEILQNNRSLGLLERPEHKRRWTRRDWDEDVRSALTAALLDALEGAAKGDTAVQSLRALATTALRDAKVRAVAALRFPGDDDLTQSLADLVEAESVPYLLVWRFTLAGLEKRALWERTWDLQRREDAGEAVGDIPVPPKYDREDYRQPRYWSLRGKLDVPRERFIAYPGATTDDAPSPLYGWAGWNHRQRAEALTALYLRRRDDDGWGAERLHPLLAGLDELIPWLKQWHNAPEAGEDLGAGDAYEAFLTTELHALGLARPQLGAWRPPEKAAARAAAKTKAKAAAPAGEGDEAAAPKKRGRPRKAAEG
ncbi:MAG: BREX-2 system adenine-specific DNA-methyltransferase PglX [Polyangiales bacterium]